MDAVRIFRNITPFNRWEGRYGEDVQWIVLHYTGNDCKNGPDLARNEAAYFASQYLGASAHFFVDPKEIWQSVELFDTAWHCGDNPPPRNGCYNITSIGIEMCNVYKNGKYYIEDATVENTAKLVWLLLDMFPNAKLCRHYDVTGKCCPAPWVEDESKWIEFQRKIKEDRPMTADERKAFDTLKNKVAALEKELTAKDAKLKKQIDANSKADLELRNRMSKYEAIEKELADDLREVDARTGVKYNTVEKCPKKWLRPTVEKLVSKDYLKGTPEGLSLTSDMARTLVVLDRAGAFDK